MAKVTEKWQRWEMSTFEYLMYLNTYSGRSYNDMTQYPVFPWVITDFQSATLDLNNPEVYRDLSKPVGALNPDRWEIYRERYEGFADGMQMGAGAGPGAMPPFMYGSHYSSAGIALHYLLRLEPFTTLAVKLQGGRFDLPDRLFDSVYGAWNLSYSNVSVCVRACVSART